MEDDSCVGPPKGSPYPGDCQFIDFLKEKALSRTAPLSELEEKDSPIAKAKMVKLLLLDVDGVLTDGSITYSENGDEVKTFNARDGFGINILRKIGVEVGIITARKSLALERRIKDLSLSHVYQGVRHKVRAYEEIIESMKITDSEVAYMGDDWLDLPLITRVGLSVAVADAMPEVRELADFVTEMGGGRGAVREVCDLIIKAQGQKESLLTSYIIRK